MEKVHIFLGSENDRQFTEEGLLVLGQACVESRVHVGSVHRTPCAALDTIRRVLEDPKLRVIIAGSRNATGLAGVVAGVVTEMQRNAVVLGVRFEKNPGQHIIEDASFGLSLVPSGVPLAYMGFNTIGFIHACMYAKRICSF